MSRAYRVITLVLLLLVPLQGAAAAIHAMMCVPHAELSGEALSHSHGAPDASHDHAMPAQHDHDTGGSSGYAGHQCCHHLSSAAPSSVHATAEAELPVYQSSLALLETLFFPEQPRRPPRV